MAGRKSPKPTESDSAQPAPTVEADEAQRKKAQDEFLETLKSESFKEGIYDSFQWENILKKLKKATNCDKITIRVMGDQFNSLENVDAEENRKHDLSAEYMHRPMLVHFDYAQGEGGYYSDPLSKVKRIREIIKQGKVIIVENTEKDKEHGEELKKLGIVSWICIPLNLQIEGGNWRTVGILTLDNVRSPNSNKERPGFEEFLQTVKARLTTKIHEAFQKRLTTIEDKLLLCISQYVEPRLLLQNIVRLIEDELNERDAKAKAEGISANAKESGMRVWDCQVFQKTDGRDNEVTRWYPDSRPERVFTEGVAYEVLTKRTAWTVDDFQSLIRPPRRSNAQPVPSSSRDRSILSMLAVPIMLPALTGKKEEQECIGVFTVNSAKANTFSYYDKELVEKIAKLSAPLLERARIEQRIQEFDLEIRKDQPIHRLLPLLLQKTKEITRIGNAAILLVTKSGKSYSVYRSEPDDLTPTPIKSLPLLPESTINVILKAGIDEKNDSKLFTQEAGGKQFVTAIRFEKSVLGLLFIWGDGSEQALTARKGAFTQIAELAGVAIHNTQVRKTLDKYEEATRRVMQSNSLYEVLENIAEMSRDLVEATSSFVALLEPDGDTIKWKALSVAAGYCVDEAALPDFKLSAGRRKSTDTKPKHVMGVTGLTIRDRKTSMLNDIAEDQKVEDIEGYYYETPIYEFQDGTRKEIGQDIKEYWREMNNLVANIEEMVKHIETQGQINEEPKAKLESIKQEVSAKLESPGMPTAKGFLAERQTILHAHLKKLIEIKVPTTTEEDKEYIDTVTKEIRAYQEAYKLLLGPNGSELVVPIVMPDQAKGKRIPGLPAMGAINITHVEPGKFSDFDVETIEKFASIAAIAINRHNNPKHPIFTVRPEAEVDCDIFLAVRFSPPKKSRWICQAVKQAADLSNTECDDERDAHSGKEQGCFDAPPIPAANRHKYDVKVADASTSIADEVWTYIARSDLLIADITGDSVNVAYEIGLAHGLNKPVILICEKGVKVPADLAEIPHVEYIYDLELHEDLQKFHRCDFVRRLRDRIYKEINKRHVGYCPPDEPLEPPHAS
jgi:GAF domain-containing protein